MPSKENTIFTPSFSNAVNGGKILVAEGTGTMPNGSSEILG